MTTYSIRDTKTGQTYIDEMIDWAWREDEIKDKALGDRAFMRAHCLDGMTLLRIFLAKFFPGNVLDDAFALGLKDTCGARTVEAVETGADTFEVRAFGQTIQCTVYR